MYVKKAGGKVFGATFTAAEQKALNLEIARELADFNRKNILEVDAIVLWMLHKHLGLGPKRLKEFYDDFRNEYDALIKRYEMEPKDLIWTMTQDLKEYGVDLEKWEEERM